MTSLDHNGLTIVVDLHLGHNPNQNDGQHRPLSIMFFLIGEGRWENSNSGSNKLNIFEIFRKEISQIRSSL